MLIVTSFHRKCQGQAQQTTKPPRKHLINPYIYIYESNEKPSVPSTLTVTLGMNQFTYCQKVSKNCDIYFSTVEPGCNIVLSRQVTRWYQIKWKQKLFRQCPSSTGEPKHTKLSSLITLYFSSQKPCSPRPCYGISRFCTFLCPAMSASLVGLQRLCQRAGRLLISQVETSWTSGTSYLDKHATKLLTSVDFFDLWPRPAIPSTASKLAHSSSLKQKSSTR